jgi:putative membrane protein
MAGVKNSVLLFAKGLAMGAADVVPGVSGGTIAFITGIYEELIETISRFNLQAIQILFKKGIKEFWTYINGNFLVTLLAGIAVSIITLAKIITGLLETYPIAIWSFFFGLVVASIPLVGRKVVSWKGSRYFAFFAGAIIAFLITQLPPVPNPEVEWYLFVSGMVAICAMILPGISGSFILLLMGSYITVLEALNNRDITLIAIFGAGCVVGLLSFSRLLKFMFRRFHDITVAILSGFLLGSLNKIWPWKKVLETVTKYAGTPKEKVVPIVEENVMPWNYTEITGEPSQVVLAIALALFGLLLIFGIERIAVKKA